MATKADHQGRETPQQMRERLGYSVARAARLADVDRMTLERIEGGGQGVTVSSLEKVSALYSLTASELLAACELVRTPAKKRRAS